MISYASFALDVRIGMNTAHVVSSAHFEALYNKLENRTARIGVIGLGYVGLPLVLLFSEQKFRVTGFDIDKSKVETLQSGGSYIRSEERRVGKECISRWTAYPYKEKAI